MSDIQEQAIIADVIDGNRDQYRFLVDRYYRGLVQHLYNIVHDEAIADDITQEAFLQAYQKLAQYNAAFAFSTWLYKIADNMAYRQSKRAVPMRDIDDIQEVVADEGPSAGQLVDTGLASQAVRRAITALPLEYQQVVTLYYWDNFSYEEIAEIMERPIGTVRTWLHRAKDLLRKELYGQI